MNLIKAADLLRNAPDEYIKRYLANPTGEYPEYLVASEDLRRKDMRQRYAAENQGQPPKLSIIEELIQGDRASLRQPTESAVPQNQMPPTAQGLGSVEPPPDVQMTPPPMIAAAQEAPQDFYDGGVVALANGGNIQHFASKGAVSYTPDLSAFNIDPTQYGPQEEPNVGNIESFKNQFSGMLGPSATEGYQDVLTKQREDLAAKKKNYLSDFLIRSGLGMAASKSPRMFQAAAEGLAGGFEDYQKAKEADAAAERSLTDAEFKFKTAKRAEDMGLLGLSRQAFDSAKADQRSYFEGKRSAADLALRSAAGKEAAQRGAAQFGLDQRKLELEAERLAEERNYHRQLIAERRQIGPKDVLTLSTDISSQLSQARKRLDDFYKEANNDPTHWYSVEKERINSLSLVEQKVARERLRRDLEAAYGITNLQSMLQNLKSKK